MFASNFSYWLRDIPQNGCPTTIVLWMGIQSASSAFTERPFFHSAATLSSSASKGKTSLNQRDLDSNRGITQLWAQITKSHTAAADLHHNHK